MFFPALILTLNLTFPVSQLGNCQSFADCKIYCEIPWHYTICTNFAIEMGVIKEKVLAATKITYPISELGNCASKDKCKAYCDRKENKTACVNFARSFGIKRSVTASEGVAPSKRSGPPTVSPISPTPETAKTLAGIKFPIAELGNCASKEDCKAYCNIAANRQTCFDFAYKHGLEKEKKEAEKLSGLQFPIVELGNCGSLAECEVYCEQPDHRQVCKEFAKEHGFKPPAGLAGPGGCQGADECNAYCSDPAHKEECQAAWEKMCAPHPDWPECQRGPEGPGGCTSDEECRAYCGANPNDEDCRRGREEWCQKNPEECKEQTGPGGCVTEEECRLYCQQNPNDEDCRRGREEWCQKNPDECVEEAKLGPGGCKTEEECKAYCEKNPNDEDCQRGQEEWCQEHPAECPPAGEAGQKPEGETSQCGSMDCGLFCQQNPNDDYCRRKNEEYCRKHPNECAPPAQVSLPTQVGPPATGEFVGPGGCKTKEECESYCREHPDKCSPQQPAESKETPY